MEYDNEILNALPEDTYDIKSSISTHSTATSSTDCFQIEEPYRFLLPKCQQLQINETKTKEKTEKTSSQMQIGDGEASIETPYQLLDPKMTVYYESTWFGYKFPDHHDSHVELGAVESPYYLLEGKFKYPETRSAQFYRSHSYDLQSYESYLKRNVRRLIQTPARANISKFDVRMTVDNMNNIYIEEFKDVKTVARELVDGVLTRAAHTVNQELLSRFCDELYQIPVVRSSPRDSFYWPQMNHFDHDKVQRIILNYVDTWELDEGFKYSIKSLNCELTEISQFYNYQVMFSRPTPSCPNPQATASVYFIIEVTLVVVPKHPIHVAYRFENYNRIHVPDGRLKFQNFLLKCIIKHKIRVFSELEF